MSYDIRLRDRETGEQVYAPVRHQLRGGTYWQGGTRELWLNVTYNYARHFRRALGTDEGIRSIYGMTGEESIPVLEAAASRLRDDESEDYWEPTEGNARRALLDLAALARMAPAAVWDGD